MVQTPETENDTATVSNDIPPTHGNRNQEEVISHRKPATRKHLPPVIYSKQGDEDGTESLMTSQTTEEPSSSAALKAMVDDNPSALIREPEPQLRLHTSSSDVTASGDDSVFAGQGHDVAIQPDRRLDELIGPTRCGLEHDVQNAKCKSSTLVCSSMYTRLVYISLFVVISVNFGVSVFGIMLVNF